MSFYIRPVVPLFLVFEVQFQEPVFLGLYTVEHWLGVATSKAFL